MLPDQGTAVWAKSYCLSGEDLAGGVRGGQSPIRVLRTN